MSTVVYLHQHRFSKAAGSFAAVEIAARRMGFSEADAIAAAVKARQEVLSAVRSPAAAVSAAKARLQSRSRELLA